MMIETYAMRLKFAWLLPTLLILFIQEVSTQYLEIGTECEVNDPIACDKTKNEVCTFKDGRYGCKCPVGVTRAQDNRCIVVNECEQARLNECDESAQCIDQTEGYTCKCNPGYADISEQVQRKPGRICQLEVNECSQPTLHNVDCSSNAACKDTADGFTCVCRSGFVDISARYSLLPGRKCAENINECINGDNDCSENAECTDQLEGYICKCRAGFLDSSPNVAHYPGRQCVELIIRTHSGTSLQIAEDNRPCMSFITTGIPCQVFNRCQQSNDCDPEAICSNIYDGYRCQCRPGYLDLSSDPILYPGRRCQKLINECAEGSDDCSPHATCEDTRESYVCHCNEEYTDVSSRYGRQPGRKCSKAADKCSDRNLNSCDENADCVALPDGYTCKCATGYVDVSSNANLMPGRVCTLNTQCATQPTDLVFIVDGSGSIGHDIFEGEVLRFLQEFIELFDVSQSQTRVGIVQYSDMLRHEFHLNKYTTVEALKRGISDIKYLTGLTRTGAAIKHVVDEAFEEKNGARPASAGVARVAIVLTDGRSQDNVTGPSNEARNKNIQLFAVGVTTHVLDSELEQIAGSKKNVFHVDKFKDLNSRLRSAIQKVTCPERELQSPSEGPCDVDSNTGCDRQLNQICKTENGKPKCTCPTGFHKHCITKVCGGNLCNPDLYSSCPSAEICRITPYGNYRCACPNDMSRTEPTGACKPPNATASTDICSPGSLCGANEQCELIESSSFVCKCMPGFERNIQSNKCQLPGTCDPSVRVACDERKREQCRPDGSGQFSCQCPDNHKRHPITNICLFNECSAETHDCDKNANCVDTDESFICTCKTGYLDASSNLFEKPGRVCNQQVDECKSGKHNCSVNADCINLPDGFLCRCKPNFVDFSPNPLHFGGTDCQPLINECADVRLNQCGQNAVCIDTKESYKCQCKPGFLDSDELRNPGRKCQKINLMCSHGKNDCDPNAKCIEKGSDDYYCVCNAEFVDQSADRNKPGRTCLERICSDHDKHVCHLSAICTEVSTPERYVCKCRDGYYDVDPTKPGQNCKEYVNECLDASLNDCDPLAACHDMKNGYTCACPAESRDDSPDKAKPGRKCFSLINECKNPHLNNCSRFADCTDAENGYSCKCKTEYHDINPAKPGTDCHFIIDECEHPGLNDCGKHATCKDTVGGFTCKCVPPYIDELQSNPGRLCRYNECEDKEMNDCDVNADCSDTDEGFICQCKPVFYDDGNDPRKPGRKCIEIASPVPQQESPPVTIPSNSLPCGMKFCRLDLGEVCIGGERCGCRPTQSRQSNDDKCINVSKIPITIRVINRDRVQLFYGTEYGNPNSPRYIDITDQFRQDLSRTIQQTIFSPEYVSNDVNYITNPKVKNSSWSAGLLFNASVAFKTPVDRCAFWEQITYALKQFNDRLGGGSLVVANDNEQLNPCRLEAEKGAPCGPTLCQSDLGEVCIADRTCGCPLGQKRIAQDQKCRPVESWSLPLWVIREGDRYLNYSDNLANPHDAEYKRLVYAFEAGISQSYARTSLKDAFVASEVNDIIHPSTVNKTWNDGIIYNFTVNFIRGAVSTPSIVFTELIDYIMKKNNYQVGESNQFIRPQQMNPFSKCFRSSCDPNANCIEDEAGYICECPITFRDLDPLDPGHMCLRLIGVNECENHAWNECDKNARCIDEERLYRCECITPYVNAANALHLPGSVCRLDYCSDVDYCPANSTCINGEEQAFCTCLPGFMNTRRTPRPILSSSGQDAICIRIEDVNECVLGLHNCSFVATCIDSKLGYECACPDEYVDGNPSLPGRICAAVLCGLCNGHGDCIHDKGTNNVTCACADGYSGQFCEIAPSKAALILPLLLALLFLLLTLCCCLYFCLKTRCFGGRGSAGSSGCEEILGSDYYTIPRPKLRKPYYSQDIASMGSSVSEEIERRVITDVKRSEVRTTTITDADGKTMTTVYGTANSMDGFGATRSTQIGAIHPPKIFMQPSIEREAEQYATMTSDHYLGGREGAAVDDGYSKEAYSTAYQNGEYADDGHDDSDAGEGVFDRTTKQNTHREFLPGEQGMPGSERLVNRFETTTSMKETNYF